MNYDELTFGVEIECTGRTRLETAQILAQLFGTSFNHPGSGYDKYEVLDMNGRRWAVMSDASLLPQKKRGGTVVSAGDEYKVEVVTPVLTYADMPLLQEVIRAMRQGGLFCNESMGQHVHICIAGFSPKQLVNLVNTVYTKQSMMYAAFGVYASRQHYCKKLPEQLVDRLKEKKPDTVGKFADIWYNELGGNYSRDAHYNNSRYHCLNLHNYLSGRQPTAELRCPNATLAHAGEVRASVEFFMLTVAYAANATRTSAKLTIPHGSIKYTFRCFLLKIGAIGERFKTLRTHMLKRLSGNTAWREIS